MSLRIAAVAGLIAMAIQSAAVQPAASPDVWGDPIDGVQLRLAVATKALPRLPGELPAFEVQIRNRGALPVTYTAEAVLFPDVSVDGVWYGQVWAGSCCAGPRTIAALAQTEVLPIYVSQPNLYDVDARPVRSLQLQPGAHWIRVRNTANDRFDLHSSARRGMVLVSNAISVEIPSLSAATERGTLIAQASVGGGNGLSPARRLVDKYPDASLAAIEAAVRATPDAGLRSEYVSLAGKLPGDVATTFLLSQLAASVGLYSQVRAAEALQARGRLDWIPPMIESWRAVHVVVRATTPDQDGKAQLIALLARSGSAEAIDALGDVAQAPVDVRVAVVHSFLPPPVNPNTRTTSSTGFSLSTVVRLDLPTLPDGLAGAAIDRLLGAALDDKAQRVGLKGTYDDVSYADPRVCDMAAFVLAKRWPMKYRFTWPTSLAARDAEIAVIRSARREK